ncbi:MAG: hypothetical protein KKC19_03455 [Nanoarchaeota archaeon]|nr:hypothetical protein [Nanoarchaeota archaeon]
MAYETQMSLETRQEVYVVSDLESLSATYLSYGTGSGSGSSSGSGGGFGALSGFNDKAPSGARPLPSLSNFVEVARNKAPSSGLPRPSLIGTYSKFEPASDFGIGPGIVDTNISKLLADCEKYLERYRAPGAGDKEDADHLNIDYLVPGKKKESGKQTWIGLANIHIPLDEE